MTIYKDLNHMEFQADKQEDILSPEGTSSYIFFFRDKNTGDIGIPIPDFTQRCVETYTKKFVETFICDVFDNNTKAYFLDRQMYIQTALTNKEYKAVVKALKNLFCKEKRFMNSLSEVDFKLSLNADDEICCDIVDTNMFKQDVSEHVRFKEFSFLMGLCDFHFEYGSFVCIERAEDFDSIKKTLIKFGVYSGRISKQVAYEASNSEVADIPF